MKKLLFSGIISVICFQESFSMKIEGGEVTILGTPRNRSPKIALHADIDMTKIRQSDFFSTSDKIPEELKPYHFDQSIPLFGNGSPVSDFQTMANLHSLISGLSLDTKQVLSENSSDFIAQLAQNCSQMERNIFELPDLNFLYYKTMRNGKQHLFLHLSSENVGKISDFKKKLNSKTVCAYNSDLEIKTQNKTELDHVNIYSRNMSLKSENVLHTRASKLKAEGTLHQKAKNLLNESEIIKGRQSLGGGLFSSGSGYQEYVKEINPLVLQADKVIQEGDSITNKGIRVHANEYYDFGKHTSNVPQKVTLPGHMEKEDSNFFGSSKTTVDTRDDVLFPNEFHVGLYVSENPELGSTLYNEMTHIFAEEGIIINKDFNLAGVAKEEHSRKVETSSSGFLSAWLGPKTPDLSREINQLQYQIRNVRGLRDLNNLGKEVTNKIKMLGEFKDDLSKIGDCLKNFDTAPLNYTSMFLKVLGKYVDAGVFIGSKKITTIQKSTNSHGNYFEAPVIEFNNKKTVIAGDVFANDIFINTGSFVILSLPQTTEMTQTVETAGVSINLLTFASCLLNPAVSGVVSAALSASTLNVNFREAQSRKVTYTPSRIFAKNKLQINAHDGHLTHTQVKAGLIHAIFTGDLVMETLATKVRSLQENTSFSTSFGIEENSEKKSKNGKEEQKSKGKGKESADKGKSKEAEDFPTFADHLKQMVLNSTFSTRESEQFERYIDEYACMIGEEEFYLEVGGLLKTKSVLFGYQPKGKESTDDEDRTEHEHISVGAWQNEEIEEISQSSSSGFTISMPHITKAYEALNKFSETLKGAINNFEQIDGDDIKRTIDENLRDAENKIDSFFSGKKYPEREKTHAEKLWENANNVRNLGNDIYQPFKDLFG